MNSERIAKPAKQDGGVFATIDILSYNINHAVARIPARAARVLDAIFSSGADVVLLAETNDAWKEVLEVCMSSLAVQF